MIGIDTFSWGKLIRLRSMKNWERLIDEIIDKIDWFITSEGVKEFKHFYPNDIEILEKGSILPILDIKIQSFKDLGFDLNDASLLEYSVTRNYRIITEDRPILLMGITQKKNIIFLIDFFAELAGAHEFINTRELYHLIKLFRGWKNIKKEKARVLENRRKTFLL